jgi:hypothetical protein
MWLKHIFSDGSSLHTQPLRKFRNFPTSLVSEGILRTEEERKIVLYNNNDNNNNNSQVTCSANSNP